MSLKLVTYEIPSMCSFQFELLFIMIYTIYHIINVYDNNNDLLNT